MSNTRGFRRIGYFTNWARYRPDGGKYFPGDIDPYLCTHIVYSFVVLENNKLKVHDQYADIGDEWSPGMYKQVGFFH